MAQEGVIDRKQLAQLMLQNLPYEPNDDQVRLIAHLCTFCSLPPSSDDPVFLLNGYAGTGKTSLTGALVKSLSRLGVRSVLLAPTGRAAKVFAEYAHHPAYTIHRRIYRQKAYSPELGGGFSLADNKSVDTVFIVDEASMLPNGTTEQVVFGSGKLLDDLIEYVFSGVNCRLILLGDNAQLPPVGFQHSPALDINELQGYGIDLHTFDLTNCVRQDYDSGILANATALRREMENPILNEPKLDTDSNEDFRRLSSEYVIETINDCYERDGMNETIVVTRSNKRAKMFNLGIRSRILYYEDELVAGDRLLITKNNYFWGSEYDNIDFIANGDVAIVQRIISTTTKFGFRFANVRLLFSDYDTEMDALINLDTLVSESPSLTYQQQQTLFNNVYETLYGPKRERFKALKQHPYFNALQVKYAYAMTCHKAQGGQWKNVFVDMGYIQPEALTSIDFYRWLYTAVTRARKQIYLMG